VSESRTAVDAVASELPVLIRFLQEFWSAEKLPAAQAPTFELALEEVFANIVMHGSRPDRIATVEVSLALAESRVTMMIEDDGPAFDPLKLPAPDVRASLADRPVGGLGVYLVQQVMDSVSYQRVGARNRLTMIRSVS
jgi:serine/threonine-protein kinase RsbW